MQKIQGFVEAGNTQLLITGAAGTIARKVQGSFPGATITVYVHASSPSVLDNAIAEMVTVAASGSDIIEERITMASAFIGDRAAPEPNLVLAEIYSDDAGTVKANPFSTPQDGTWYFYAEDGRYDVRFSGGGIATPFTIGDLQAFDVTRPGGIRNAAQFPGVDAGEKIANALADLPSTGGIVDARGLGGDQTIGAALTLGNVTLLLGVGTYTLGAGVTIHLQNGSRIVGAGCSRELGYGTAIRRGAGSATMISAVGTAGAGHIRNFELRDFFLTGSGLAGHGIVVDYVDSFRFENVHCLHGGAGSALRILNDAWDFWIVNCGFSIWGDPANYTIYVAGLDGFNQITDGHWFGNQIGELTTGAPILYCNGFVLQQRFVDCKFHLTGGVMTHMIEWWGYRSAFVGCSFQNDTPSSSGGMFRSKGTDTNIIGCHFHMTYGDAIHVFGTSSLNIVGNVFRGIGTLVPGVEVIPAPGSGVVTEAGATGSVSVSGNDFFDLTCGYDFYNGNNFYTLGPSNYTNVTTPLRVPDLPGGGTWTEHHTGHANMTIGAAALNTERDHTAGNNPALSLGANGGITNVSGWQNLTTMVSSSGPGAINESIGLGSTQLKYTGLGCIDGANIQHPFIWGASVDPTVFAIYRKRTDAAIEASDLRFRFNQNETLSFGADGDTSIGRGTANTLELGSGDSFRPADSEGQKLGDAFHTWRPHIDVVPTASLPAGDNAMHGAILMEQSGNLILYLGSVRFRITGVAF
ncbi:MAG TPA: right-handed parallel beta-helix repeat-containing protein [Candidatus Limnocylindrales bacterium]|nr:right-handed parallel beta-helix repeat-containing protein [Candidatus Limnocylindrales bacterium]